MARASKLLGSIFTSELPGTTGLYEFISTVNGNDHAYSTKVDEYKDKNNYQLANEGEPIGYVYPAY